MNRYTRRSGIEQRGKLALGRLERLVGHVIDEANPQQPAGLSIPNICVENNRHSDPPFGRDQAGRLERLFQVAENIVDVLNADAEPNHLRKDTSGALFFM